MVSAVIPQSISEVLSFISKNEAIILNGGTDLMTRKKTWSGVAPSFDRPVMFINSLRELKNITIEENKLIIGSACTFSQLEKNLIVPEYLKVVIREIASPAIRNIATIGGNICNASPAADILPPLYALGAKVVLTSENKERIVAIKDFILSPGKNILTSKELLKEVIIEDFQRKNFYYHKLGTRKSTALSKASFIGFYDVDNNVIKDIRVAFGSVAPTIICNRDLELDFIGSSIQDMKFKVSRIVERYSELIRPIDDARSSAKYRKAVCLNLLRDFLLNKVKNELD